MSLVKILLPILEEVVSAGAIKIPNCPQDKLDAVLIAVLELAKALV